MKEAEFQKYLNKIKIQRHKDTYINFRSEAEPKRLTKKELEEKLIWLKDNNFKYIFKTTIREKFKDKNYSLTYNDRNIYLAYYYNKEYFWFSTNYRDDAKNKKTADPFPKFKTKFKERNNISINDAFGATKQNFKIFSPQPLYYISGLWPKNEKIYGVKKEDFSSHYPSAATKILPDAKTALYIDEYARPNEEYEFAFYPDSGNIAIYKEFDSHDYLKEVKIFSAKTTDRVYKTDYTAKDTRTILMKRAKYDLIPEINYYYDIKNSYDKDSKEYKDAKLFLLKFIGMFEQCNISAYNRIPLAHLAAVIKWRANIKTFNLIRKIKCDNIIQICVDGILHRGDIQGVSEKKLGNLITEISNGILVQKGINQYVLKEKDKIEKRHAGFDINTDSDNIKDWQVSEKVKFLDYIKNHYEIEEK